VRHVIQPAKKEGFHQIKRAPFDKADMENDVVGPISKLLVPLGSFNHHEYIIIVVNPYWLRRRPV